jgi:hypothetical protein
MISWERIPKFPNLSRILIQKSGSQEGGWRTIDQRTVLDPPFFFDLNANNTFHRHDIEFYRLVFPEAKIVSKSASSYGVQDPLASEISRRHRIRLNQGKHGNPMYLFTRIRGGDRCPDCWDDYEQKRTKSNCKTCLGTSMIGGYYSPLETYVKMTPESTKIEIKIDGPTNDSNRIQAWTSAYPLLNVDDVFIEKSSNRVWTVESIQINTLKRVVVSQSLVLIRSSGDDPVWALVKKIPGYIDKNSIGSTKKGG